MNRERYFAFSVVPSLICIGGVFFLHFGLWAGIAVYNISRFVGLANTMSPLMKYQEQIETSQTVSDRPLPALLSIRTTVSKQV